MLRLDEGQTLRWYLLELSPGEAPFIPGLLIADTDFYDVWSMIQAALRGVIKADGTLTGCSLPLGGIQRT